MQDEQRDEARGRAGTGQEPLTAPSGATRRLTGTEERHRVVIVGCGFGGLEAVKCLTGAPVKVTLIDQRNYHLFQPLLYQVATTSLAPSEVAWPIRFLVRSRPEVTTLLATVIGVDADDRRVVLEGGGSPLYDTLILATGARHAYFGHGELC